MMMNRKIELLAREAVTVPLLMQHAVSEATLCAVERYVAKRPRTENDQTDLSKTKRDALAVWIEKTSETAAIYDDITESFHLANNTFGIAVEELQDPLLYAEYPVGGHFTWHTDHWPAIVERRKISCSILLSEQQEYSGGNFEFCPGGRFSDFVGRGTGVFFPAYHAHRITKVKSGIRRVLVAWMNGRPFC